MGPHGLLLFRFCRDFTPGRHIDRKSAACLRRVFDRFDNALAVIEFARIPAKSESVTITVKRFFAHGRERSQESAFDQRAKRFGAVPPGWSAIILAE